MHALHIGVFRGVMRVGLGQVKLCEVWLRLGLVLSLENLYPAFTICDEVFRNQA